MGVPGSRRPKPQTVADWLEDFYSNTEAFPEDFLVDRDQEGITQDRSFFNEDA